MRNVQHISTTLLSDFVRPIHTLYWKWTLDTNVLLGEIIACKTMYEYLENDIVKLQLTVTVA